MYHQSTQTQSVQLHAVSSEMLEITDGAIRVLQEAVTECQMHGGGVVALVGAAGFGKSILAKEFSFRHSDAVYLDAMPTDGHRKSAPDLTGIPVIDEAWQFDGITQSIKAHVTRRGGTAIVIASNDLEARAICGEWLRAVVELPHWAGLRLANGKSKVTNVRHATQAAQPVSRSRKISGIIRFRGPNGEGWAGHGRPPNWLVTLESSGSSREQYRIDSTPLTSNKRA